MGPCSLFLKNFRPKYFYIATVTLIFSLQEISIATQSAVPSLPTTTTDITKQSREKRKAKLTEMKDAADLTTRDKKTLKSQSKARTTEQVGGKIVSSSDKIASYLASSNFLNNTINLVSYLSPVPFLNAIVALGLLNNVVGVVGEGIEAYGSYKLREVALVGGISGAVNGWTLLISMTQQRPLKILKHCMS